MCFCQQIKGNFYLLTTGFFALNLIVLCILGYFFLKKKNSFPIKEKSPLLSFSIIISVILHLSCMPILTIYFKISSQPYRIDGNLELIIKFIILWSRFSIFTIYILKSLRLWYPFSTKMSSILVKRFFL